MAKNNLFPLVGAAEEDSGSALNRPPLRSSRRKSSLATPLNAVKCTGEVKAIMWFHNREKGCV